MKSDCGSFLNFTNNRLESLNGKLKQVIDHHSSLEEFFDKFFVILNSFRRKRDHKVATMFQKIKVSCFKDDSPESHYSKFLSSYAAQFVHKQLHLAHKVSTITANGECYVVDTTEGQTNLTPSTCECIFNKSMLLPCRHIFALRIKLDQPLFDTALCDKRWSVAYYQSTHKLFFEQSAADLSTLTVTSEKHHQALSQHQKFHEASLITTELASLASMVSNIHYKRRIELLKELVEFWKNGQMVGLTEISQSMFICLLRPLCIYLFIYFKCFLMQVKPALMACGQHVPTARENIHTHKLLQYTYYSYILLTLLQLYITVNYSWLCFIVKALPCVWKMQHKGLCQEANAARGKAKCCIFLETPPSTVFFIHTSIRSALSVLLYFLVVLLGAIFFGDQNISKTTFHIIYL